MNKIIALITFCLCIVLLANNVVMAQFGTPHQFYGEVTINGEPASDGILIIARIDGNDVGGAITAGGSFGRDPPGEIFYIEDPYETRNGSLVEFFINEIKAGEHYFTNRTTAEVDLEVKGEVKTEKKSSSRRSSSPGVLPVNVSDNTPVDTVCTENWECTEWLDCVNGKQRRICSDTNNCGTEVNKPEDRKTCLNAQLCVENWTCSDWSLCKPDNTQERGCIDANSCGTENFKPELNQNCTYSPFAGGITGFFLNSQTGLLSLGAIIVAIILALFYVKKK